MPVAALSLFALALPVLVAGRFGAPAPAPRAQRTPGSLGARAGSSSGTSTALWPLPLSDSRTASCKWTLQGKDVAAVSPDCPYSGHGPDASLEGCQAACVSAGGDVCTTLNWNPTLPDCVFRRCADPAHPNLTATPGYSVFSVQRPAVTAYGLAPQFAFRAAAGGFSNALLEAALARAGAQAFPYGQGQAPSLPGPTLAALEVDVASSDAVLRLGVDESYTIVVDPRAPVPARLAAPTIFGAMRGLETFAQLVSYNLSDASYACEAVQISDAPRFPFRGVMLDTSRHFISVSVIKQVVDMMAAVKLNTLSLHLNDDNSWPLYVPSHPQLSLQGAYSNFSHTYLPEDMKDLVAFAATRGVRVLPEFDSPSHFGTLSQSYPQFAATTQDGSACMVDPSREEVFDFLAAVWGDIAGMFPDAQFRIGGDEFQGCWSDCPAVMAWIRGKWGVNGTVYDAYHYYVRRVINITRGLERSSMAWLDVEGFPDARAGETWAKDYPDVTLNVWTGCCALRGGAMRLTRRGARWELTASQTPSPPRHLPKRRPGQLADGHCPIHAGEWHSGHLGALLHHHLRLPPLYLAANVQRGPGQLYGQHVRGAEPCGGRRGVRVG